MCEDSSLPCPIRRSFRNFGPRLSRGRRGHSPLDMTAPVSPRHTRREVLVFACASIVMGAMNCAALAQRSATTGANQKGDSGYAQKAREVTDEIHRKFWMPKAQRYAGKAGGQNADAVWGAGVMFSALVGATRHDPAQYKSLLGKFYDG